MVNHLSTRERNSKGKMSSEKVGSWNFLKHFFVSQTTAVNCAIVVTFGAKTVTLRAE